MSYSPQSPGEIEAAGRYHAFLRGWTHAAGCRPQDPAFTENQLAYIREEYAAGFIAGLAARRHLSAELTARTGHMPTILRAGGEAPVPAGVGTAP